MSGGERRNERSGAHPAPRADEIGTGMGAFLLFTGPLAWFAQLCIGFALLSWPCYPYDLRLSLPLDSYGWTQGVALLLLLACAVLAAASGLVSWRMLHRVDDETQGDKQELADVGEGRTRFTALWGMILGVGFTLATLTTLAGFALVPRCAG